MKKFAVRIIQISFIIFMMSVLLNLLVYPALNIAPWTWGSDLLQTKREHLLNSPEEYNTLIIGSSRVYRQVNPPLLDSLTGKTLNLKTYNLGINWLFAPESFYVLDQLTNTDHLKFKCVVIELSKIRSIDYSNLHTARIKYWYNFSDYTFAVRSVAGSNFSLPEKGATMLVHTISYLDQLINLGYITEAFGFNASLKKSPASEIGYARNGYEPLDITGQDSPEENTADRHSKFLSDTTAVTRRFEVSVKQFERYEQHPELLKKYNKFYADGLNKMIRQANEKGIYLVFLLSPRIDKNQYNELIPLFNKLDPAHRIEISDGRKYPELYRACNSFDETHLNSRGADIYTSILAAKLLLLLEKR